MPTYCSSASQMLSSSYPAEHTPTLLETLLFGVGLGLLFPVGLPTDTIPDIKISSSVSCIFELSRLKFFTAKFLRGGAVYRQR